MHNKLSDIMNIGQTLFFFFSGMFIFIRSIQYNKLYYCVGYAFMVMRFNCTDLCVYDNEKQTGMVV